MARFTKRKRDNRFTTADLAKQQDAYAGMGFGGFNLLDGSLTGQLSPEYIPQIAGTFDGLKTRAYTVKGVGDGEFDGTKIKGRRTQNWYLREVGRGAKTAKVRVQRPGPPDEKGRITVIESYEDLPMYMSLRPQAGPVLPADYDTSFVPRGGFGYVPKSDTIPVTAELRAALNSLRSKLDRAANNKFVANILDQHVVRLLATATGASALNNRQARNLKSLARDLAALKLPVNAKFDVSAELAVINTLPVEAFKSKFQGATFYGTGRKGVKYKSAEEAKAAQRERAKAKRASQPKSEKPAKRKGRKAKAAKAPAETNITNIINEAPIVPAQEAAAPETKAKTPSQRRARSTKKSTEGGEIRNNRYHRDNGMRHHRDNAGFSAANLGLGAAGFLGGALVGVPVTNLAARAHKHVPTVVGGALALYGLASIASDEGNLMGRQIAFANPTHRSLATGAALGLALPMLATEFTKKIVGKILPDSFLNLGAGEAAPAAPTAGFGSIYSYAGTGMYESVDPVAQLSAFGEDSELDEIDDVDPALEGLSAYVAEQQGASGFGEYIAASGFGATAMTATAGFGEDGTQISVPNYLNGLGEDDMDGEDFDLEGLGEEIDPEEMFAFEGLGAGVTVTAGNALTGLGLEIEGSATAGLGEDDLDDDDLEDLSGLGEADMDDEDLDLEGLGAVARRRSAARRAAASGRASRSGRAAASAKIVRMTPATINKIASSSKMRRVVAIRVLRKSKRVPNTFIVAIGKSKREAVPAPGAILRKPNTMGINPAPVGQERFQPGGVFAENVFGKKIL